MTAPGQGHEPTVQAGMWLKGFPKGEEAGEAVPGPAASRQRQSPEVSSKPRAHTLEKGFRSGIRSLLRLPENKELGRGTGRRGQEVQGAEGRSEMQRTRPV